MLKEIKYFFSKSIVGNLFIICLSYIHTFLSIIIFSFFKYLRYLNIPFSEYSEIKKYKNIHNGDRCFIIATGPSLALSDVEKLKNEYTFSMNSICHIFKETDWRPTYYGIQDGRAFSRLETDLIHEEKMIKFISHNVSKYLESTEVKNIIQYPLNLGIHGSRLDRKFKTKKFSSNCSIQVYDGYTITYSLLQIAVYMGFKEIYLLGVDASYSPNKMHFSNFGPYNFDFSNQAKKMIDAYKVAEEYTRTKGIKVYNVTRGGELEVFERRNLDELVLK